MTDSLATNETTVLIEGDKDIEGIPGVGATVEVETVVRNGSLLAVEIEAEGENDEPGLAGGEDDDEDTATEL